MAEESIHLCDYAVAFIDLLGQKAEMPGRHLPNSPDDAVALVKRSVGKIIGTQKIFESFYESSLIGDNFFERLPPYIQEAAPDMARGVLKKQLFSDGMVVYIPLGEGIIQSPINSIFSMLIASASLCVVGLAAKGPLRIGIDVAWAVEYRPGELYGAALAYAHHLESKVAQWPRVVVGEGLINYLNFYSGSTGSDVASKYRREMARLCLSLIAIDVDGCPFLHYLGEGFGGVAPGGMEGNEIDLAKSFIQNQLAYWTDKGNAKLAERYCKLNHYYELHRPTK